MDRTDPFWPSMRAKSLSPPGRHHFVPLWNDTDGALRREIIESLVNTEWHVIDVLRLGYDRIDGEEPGHWLDPITLLVSVEPGAVVWEDGHAAVMRCKAILESHGINDVHCEMKEARVYSAVPPPVSSPVPSPVSSPVSPVSSPGEPVDLQLCRPPTYLDRVVEQNAQVMLSDCAGVAIGVGSLGGTKGLYLRKNETADDDPTILALTCRHAVFARKDDDRK